MSRRPRLLGRRLLPITVSVLAGLALGVGVSGLPDTEALNPIAGRPPLTVKPGALIDPSELTVPPMVRSSSTLVTSNTDTVISDAPVQADDGLTARSELVVMVANGNGTAGTATKWAGELVTLGYFNPQVGNTNPTESWVVYYASGFDQEATQLAQELSSVPGASAVVIAPIEQAPSTQPGFEGQLLVVIGTASR